MMFNRFKPDGPASSEPAQSPPSNAAKPSKILSLDGHRVERPDIQAGGKQVNAVGRDARVFGFLGPG